ncbi:MAG: NAD-dependent epimerase/dehydratase family protein [Planctomycetaceae bacterium]|nr:NAD-dependent epimerase/dehydratase family protein [Planctomycetaceae bacterium]
MSKKTPRKISRGMAVRMLADVMLMNLALVAALVIRFLILLAMGPEAGLPNPQATLWKFFQAYWQNAPILSVICLAVFAREGFYTYEGSYNGKYKPLIIVKAVALTFLTFGVSTYLFWDLIGLQDIPRGAFLLTAAICLLLCLSARTWSALWERVVRPDRESRLRNRVGNARNVLVIGGAGYIGSALLPKLLAQGCRVRVLDRFLFGEKPIEGVAGHPRLELVEGDFRHVDKVVEAMQGMDAVVHLGAIVGDPASALDEQVTVAVNLTATQMIAQVAKACGVSRFIFASTCSVYGASDELLDEQSKVKPISLYGRTKLAAEQGLLRMADEHFAPTVIRFATIYGLSGRTRFDLVVNLLAAMAKVEGKITVHGGDQWRPFVHVDDAALAVSTLLQTPLSAIGNQIFNIGSDEQNYTIRQVGELIHEQAFTADLMVYDEDVDKRNYRVSFKKLKAAIGFRPQWTLEQGIAQVLEAVISGAIGDYRDKQYSNVKYLKESGLIDLLRVDDDWSDTVMSDDSSMNLPKTEALVKPRASAPSPSPA